MLDRLSAFYSLAKRFEGCRLIPYYCPAGILTCGWGSTGHDVFPGRSWTQEYADKRLEQDGVMFAAKTLAICPILALDDKRLSAITDFCYNLGAGRLKGSTLRKRINTGSWEDAAKELGKWVYGGGRKLPGLVARRAVEATMII